MGSNLTTVINATAHWEKESVSLTKDPFPCVFWKEAALWHFILCDFFFSATLKFSFDSFNGVCISYNSEVTVRY